MIGNINIKKVLVWSVVLRVCLWEGIWHGGIFLLGNQTSENEGMDKKILWRKSIFTPEDYKIDQR